MREVYCPGNQTFSEILNSPYVDKTMLIEVVNNCINRPNRYLCVPRPRRFGKTYAADMLTAYYDRSCNSEALFAPLKIGKSPSFRQHLNQYHVLRLDGTMYINIDTVSFTEEGQVPRVDLVEAMAAEIREELLSVYPDAGTETSDLLTVLKNVVSATGTKFIVILDEWDAFLREFPDNEKLKHSYMLFLRRLFKTSVSDALFAAVYLTGIMPIMRWKTESGLNNFDELTMLSPGATADLFGFTEEEVRQYLSGSNLSFEEAANWYDGYQVGGQHVFNPYVICDALDRGEAGPWWVQTTSNGTLKECICRGFKGLSDAIDDLMKGIPVSFCPSSFSNDISKVRCTDDVLTLLAHLGYLNAEYENPVTYKALIPNREIYRLFKRTILEGKRTLLYEKLQLSDEILDAIFSKAAAAVARFMAFALVVCTTQTTYYNHEDLKSTIREALISAAENYLRWEAFPPEDGIAAILYLPKKYARTPAILIELKRKPRAKSAIRQIKNGNYPAYLKDYTGEILLVGIAYSTKKRAYKGTIESFDMKNGTLSKP